MDRWVGKVAIVTGASSGIGAAIASRLVEEGLKVVAIARRRERLESLAENLSGNKGQLYPFVANLANSDELIKAFEWTKQNVGLVHILVNNAGLYRVSPLVDFKIEDLKDIYDLNVFALTIATREALKVFKEHHIQGHIININSIAGHWVSDVNGHALYASTKHAVTALTQSTYLEMKNMKLGAKATSISPGFVETAMTENEIFERWQRQLQVTILKAEEIADAAVYVLSTSPNCQIDELTIRPIVPKQ